jgi:hypothetical protein
MLSPPTICRVDGVKQSLHPPRGYQEPALRRQQTISPLGFDHGPVTRVLERRREKEYRNQVHAKPLNERRAGFGPAIT